MFLKTRSTPETPHRNLLKQWEQTVSQLVLCAYTHVYRISIGIYHKPSAACIFVQNSRSLASVFVFLCLFSTPNSGVSVWGYLPLYPCVSVSAQNTLFRNLKVNYLLCLLKSLISVRKTYRKKRREGRKEESPTYGR